MNTKYEYKILKRLCEVSNLTNANNNEENSLETLNKLGIDGWEMCGQLGTKRSGLTGYIFKRKINNT